MTQTKLPATTPLDLRTLSLLGRFAPGLQHRINNVATVLLISAQTVAEFDGVPDDQRQHVEEILADTSKTLALLQLIFSQYEASEPTNLSTIVSAVASSASGINHRVSVNTEPSGDVLVSAPHPIVRDIALLAALILHDILADGGFVSIGASPGQEPTLLARAVAKEGTQTREEDTDDMAHLSALCAAAQAKLKVSKRSGELELAIHFRAG